MKTTLPHQASPLILMPQSSTNPFYCPPTFPAPCMSVFCIYGRIADMSTTSEMVDMTIKEQEPKNKQTFHCKRRQKFQLDSNSNKQQAADWLKSNTNITNPKLLDDKSKSMPSFPTELSNELKCAESDFKLVSNYSVQRLLPSFCSGTWNKVHLK